MRLLHVALAVAILLPLGCSSNRVAGGRMDTGEEITIHAVNNAGRRVTIAFSWHRDEPVPLGAVADGEEDTWTTVWQDLALRMVVDRSELNPAFSSELRPQPGDTVRLVVEGTRMSVSIQN